MPLTTSLPPKFEEYRISGDIPASPHYKTHPYVPPCRGLTRRRPKPVLPRNPLHRVLQSELPPPRRKVRVMAPRKGEGDSLIPTAACRWKKETLDLLNAKYEPALVTPFDFGDVLKIPPELQKRLNPIVRLLNKGIAEVANELANINDSNQITPEYVFQSSEMPSIAMFSKFYAALNKTIRKESPDPPAPQTDTPPVRTTIPPNLRHDSPASIRSNASTASTSSKESTAEHFTHALANDFLWATFETIGISKYKWGHPKTQLIHGAFSASAASLII